MKKFTDQIKFLAVVASLVLVTSGVIYAQSAGRDMPTFESFDLNNDGIITKDELDKARDLRAQERKKDGRGLRGPRNNYEFSEIDLNSDGKITKEEFEKHQLQSK